MKKVLTESEESTQLNKYKRTNFVWFFTTIAVYFQSLAHLDQWD